jgi:uncharacterized protein (TIGR00369 family)
MRKELEREFMDLARSRVRQSKFSALMGFEVEKLFRGSAVVSMKTEDRHRQIHNVMHGGVLAALADTAAAIAAYTAVPRGTEVVTVELKINYLLPVGRGKVRAEGRVLRAGRNFVVVECDITNEEGAMAAKALMTFGAAPGHEISGDRHKKGAGRKPAPTAQRRSTG